MFATPVAYPSSLRAASRGGTLFGLNPMAGVVEGFRWALARRHGARDRSSPCRRRGRWPLLVGGALVLPAHGTDLRGRDLEVQPMSDAGDPRRGPRQALPRSAARGRATRTAPRQHLRRRRLRAVAALRVRRSRGRRGADRQRSGPCRTSSFEVQPRRGGRHHRPQRRRQEHAAEDPLAASPSRPTGGVDISRPRRSACWRSAPASTPS